jgi:citrate synthase
MTKTRKSIISDMGRSSATRVEVRGLDLCEQILGRVNLGDMAFLELMGRLPSSAESTVFNAILATLVEHGLTPHAIAARLVYLGAPESLQAAVAAGLCGMGTVFAGGAEGVAKLLQENMPENVSAPLEPIAKEIVRDFMTRKAIVPGLGHPVHKPHDPRTVRLFEIAGENGLRGRHVRLMELIGLEAERAYGKTLPINATGAIGAISCELDLPWQIARGIAVIGRAIGLVGHLLEEIRQPIAREIWERAEEEAHGATKAS